MSGKLAAHQPNFIPWLPYFHKMAKCDVFISMINCQFEKNGFQNRAFVKGKWWTVPVFNGTDEIRNKVYANGEKLVDVNMSLIMGIAKTLGISTSKIHYDFKTDKKGTERIIELCKKFDCDQYLTNPDAMNKYLDERAMNDAGIEVVACDMPQEYKKSIFEAFDEYGVEGTSKIIHKDFSRCKA